MNPHAVRPAARWWSVVVLASALALAVAGCGADEPGGDADRSTSGGEPDRGASASPTTAWEWRAPDPSYAGMPAADGDEVAATYGTRGLVLLDGTDGDVVWQTERLDLRDVAPRFAPGVVLAAADDGVVAFERDTGVIRWDATLGERANTPVVAGGRAVVSTWEGSLVALDLADGRVAWRVRLPGPALGPAATDGSVGGGDLGVGQGGGGGGGRGRRRQAAVGGAARGRRGQRPGDRGWRRWRRRRRAGAWSWWWRATSPPTGSTWPTAPSGGAPTPRARARPRSRRWPWATARSSSPTASAGWPCSTPPPADPAGRCRATASRSGAARPAEAPDGPFAFPLDDGRVLVAAPDQETGYVGSRGRVSGVALGPGGILVMGTREGAVNGLLALSGW